MNATLNRVGIPPSLGWGYLGILIFMMGDGLEIGWLSPYLKEHGLTVEQNASLFAAYGITIAISSWFSGVLSEGFGIKKTMFLGFLLYVLGTIGFVGWGVPTLNYNLMVPTYALRGFGYPLFAYSFLVWIAYRSPQERLSTAVGWFWFVFTGGLNVLGAYYSIWAIKNLGHINTLWSSLLWVTIGAIFALVFIKDKFEVAAGTFAEKTKELLHGLTIVAEEPKVLIGGIVRVINTTAQGAFPVFLPLYMEKHGIATDAWLGLWGTIFIANIAFNLFFGFVGDKFGWQRTVMWFGGVGCGVTTLLLFYTPEWFGAHLWMVYVAGILWGGLLAGYVPLSALVPSLVEKDKGAAMAILNLGAGLPFFVGPAIVWAFHKSLGDEGIVWILAGLYFLSAFLCRFLTLPNREKSEQA